MQQFLISFTLVLIKDQKVPRMKYYHPEGVKIK